MPSGPVRAPNSKVERISLARYRWRPVAVEGPSVEPGRDGKRSALKTGRGRRCAPSTTARRGVGLALGHRLGDAAGDAVDVAATRVTTATISLPVRPRPSTARSVASWTSSSLGPRVDGGRGPHHPGCRSYIAQSAGAGVERLAPPPSVEMAAAARVHVVEHQSTSSALAGTWLERHRPDAQRPGHPPHRQGVEASSSATPRPSRRRVRGSAPAWARAWASAPAATAAPCCGWHRHGSS